MWIVQLSSNDKDESICIVAVNSAASKEEAIAKAASQYAFYQGYDVIARQIDPNKDVQEVFNSSSDSWND